ncbi:transcriptional regulator [Marinobacterium zhoushanense]|uniref:Transcriptional regulator n=1 Tax=Marinobacterium zhoushanense TaxID=1679163 RepID=A0ABQ1KAQ7_9GAMM|nr:LacI family DNA-binding transcriptional regulator [Marinobacterium zhoushanense]GGB94066.1 transcriptional regulator [Marinobacterium zhoushanense]
MTAKETELRRMTIKDVARHIGVSTATISNAFNRPDQLSVELRERILNECKNLGYRSPGLAPRSPRPGRTGVIGVVLSDCLSYNLKDCVANQFLTGLTEELDKAQLSMLMLSAKEIDSGCQFRQHEAMVDGFIVYGQMNNRQAHEQLLRQRKQLVSVDCIIEDSSSIQSDNFGGALVSARHALTHQPQRVAVLGLRLIDSRHVCRVYDPCELFDETESISVQRLRGYNAAFTERNRQLLHDNIWNIPVNNHACAQQAAREALLCTPRPELLLCMSDTIAIAALQEAQKLGIRIPEDLKIVGFDGIPEALSCYPSLTTVYQNSIEKGRQAGRLFLGNTDTQQIMLSTELLIGGSCPRPSP